MDRRVFLLTLVTASLCAGQNPSLRKWKIEGVDREALVFAPRDAKAEPLALVFVFHGHGGDMDSAANSFHLQSVWPQAIVVYPQGLPTPGTLTDREGKRRGWQSTEGLLDNRDLKFFDAMLKSLQAEYRVKRVYSTGHSNGGGFTYLLWAHRGGVLSAVAPSGAVAAPADRLLLKPKPVLHIAGRYDRLVRFSWQEAMIAFLKSRNGNEPVETFLYEGGHAFPADAPERIAEFFRKH